MKTFKLSRKVQIILATIFVIVVGAIIVGGLSNDEILAVKDLGTSCNQGYSGLVLKEDGNKQHAVYCEQCEAVLTEKEDCTPKSIWEYKQDTNLHPKLCEECDGVCEEEACYDNNGDGVCDANCGNTSMHSKSSTVKEYTKITETTHIPVYTCIQEGCTETTVSGLKASIETNATEVNIYNRDNELINDTDQIGTGMKVELKNEDQTKTFTIIVKGDTDGDVTGGGKVDFNDILKINKFRLHKITEL